MDQAINNLNEVCILESSGGDSLMTETTDAKRSLVIKDLLDLEHEEQDRPKNDRFGNLITGEIKLPIPTNMLEKVITWMESEEIHRLYPEETTCTKTDQECQTDEKMSTISFKEGFFMIPMKTLFEMIKTAEYLQLACLQHLSLIHI